MGSASRYIEAVDCPRCGRRGCLYAKYVKRRSGRGWRGPYFVVAHRKYRYSPSLYRELRKQGYSSYNAFGWDIIVTDEVRCNFGRAFPSPIHHEVRTPDDEPKEGPRRKRRKYVLSNYKPYSRRLGKNKPRVKLTATQIDEIRRRYAEGETQVSLAKHFGVAQSQISFITRGWTITEWMKKRRNGTVPLLYKTKLTIISS